MCLHTRELQNIYILHINVHNFQTGLSSIVNNMAVDDLATKGARASATSILIYFDIPVSEHERVLNFKLMNFNL